MASERGTPPTNLSELIILRPVAPEDYRFLLKVYANTRADELAATGWLDVQKQAFINMQFKLQQQGYREQFPAAAHDIIMFDDQPVGRLMVDRTGDEIRCVSIAILSEFRNLGIGMFLLRGLCSEAVAADQPLRLQVDRFNSAAYRLYERLGFVKTEEGQTHIAMEWTPSA